jgi:hypothetical protein
MRNFPSFLFRYFKLVVIEVGVREFLDLTLPDSPPVYELYLRGQALRKLNVATYPNEPR